jgi:hypothetical protein
MFEPARQSRISSIASSACRRLANLRPGAGAETLGQLKAHLDNPLGARRAERLRVSISDDEVDPGQARDDHIVDRVAAGASHAAHHNSGLQFLQLGGLQIDRHTLPHLLGARGRRLTLRGLARQDRFSDSTGLRRIRLPPMVPSGWSLHLYG